MNDSDNEIIKPTQFIHSAKFDEKNTLKVNTNKEQSSPLLIEYISLYSADGFQFIVPFDIMSISQTIFNMVKGSGEFKEVKSVIQVPIKTPNLSDIDENGEEFNPEKTAMANSEDKL